MPGEAVKALRDRRLQVWEQAKGIADRASSENRAFSAEEQGQWDVMTEEMSQLDTRIRSALEAEQRSKEAQDMVDKLVGGQKGQNGASKVPATQRSAELRAFLRGDPGTPRSLEVRWSGDAPIDFRNITKLSGTGGSFTVPTDFYARLMAHLIETSAVLQAQPTVLTTDSGEQIQIPKTTAHSSAALVAEAGTIGTSESVFGQVTLGSFKYGHVMYISRELLNDTGVDLEGYLAMQSGRALGNAFGAHMVTGTGTSQPTGVITSATVGVTGATGLGGGFATGVGGGDPLFDLFYSVIAPYRASQSCYWLLRDSTLGTLRKLKDTVGQYLWQPSLQVGAPDLLLGKPIVVDPNVPAIGIGNKSIVFGDFSQFFVRLAGGVRFERSDDFKFDSDLVSFRALLRADAALVDLTGAIKVFQGGAS